MENPKRRQSVGFTLKLNPTNLEENDDEAEKLERRKSRGVALSSGDMEESPTGVKLPSLNVNIGRKSVGPKKTPPDNMKDISDSQKQEQLQKKKMTNAQLTSLYTNVIKLATDNKINSKNSWQLNLIDYIDDVIEVQRDAEMTNFQVASCTLDASVKIYSCRVDSVHNETYKVLGGLNRTERTEESGDGETEENETKEAVQNEEGEEEKVGEPGENQEGKDDTTKDGNQKEKAQKKKKLNVGGVNTLEANEESLALKKLELEFEVDPLFRKTCSTFDEGGCKGMLLNQLAVYKNCELMLDSRDFPANDTEPASIKDFTCDISDLQKKLTAASNKISVLKICPTFANFEFSRPKKKKGEDEDDEDDLLLDNLQDDDIPGVDFGGNDDPDEEIQTAMQKEQRLIEEINQGMLDDDNGEMPQNNDFLIENPMHETTPAKDKRKSIAENLFEEEPHFSELVQAEGEEQLLNFLNVKNLNKNWAGPSHWKFKVAPAKTLKTEEGEEDKDKAKKPKKKKETFYINFHDADVDVEKAFAAPGRAATTLSTAALKKAQSSAKTLPEDVHYDVKMLTQLFTKPKWRITVAKRRRIEQLNNMKESNLGEALEDPHGDVLLGVGPDDDEDGPIIEPGGAFNREDGEVEVNAPVEYGDLNQNLIQEPKKVEEIKISYAKTAKFVDVKKLKETLWQEMEEERKSHKDKKEPIPFETILEDLPTKVSGEALENISVPFCFICLLHLANEKELSLVQEKGNLSELSIVHTK